MAIVLRPNFPIPDRSLQPVRSTKDEDGVIDIGWCEGVLLDGRAFRAEMWAQNGVSMLTFFFSSRGLEDLEPELLLSFVENEELVSFRGVTKYCAASKFLDDAEQEVWCVNIAVGDEEQTYVNKSVSIFPNSRVGEPNTMFNSVPIKAAFS